LHETAIISALGTPLNVDDSLNVEGFALHFQQQIEAGIDGVLVGGSMGAMQMLRQATYSDLVRNSAALANNSIELLVGVGDASLGRTIDRIRMLASSKLAIDGVVILSPYMSRFSQLELTDYFTHLANESCFPVFLYDLPQLSRNKIEVASVRYLSQHPNIRGIKCSDDFIAIEPLLELHRPEFRVIVSKPQMLAELLAKGIPEHLDGMFALAPRWVTRLRDAATKGDQSEADHIQREISLLFEVVTGTASSAYAVFTTLLNSAGIPGNFAPSPFGRLDDDATDEVLQKPIVLKWLADHAVAAYSPSGAR
jgi:dihydrodipicolinate synthase/N-acetylneuraminate lyase